MAQLNSTFTALVELFDGDDAMRQACLKGKFFTIANPLFGGGYAIGSMGAEGELFPELYPTLEAANAENASMREQYLADIANGDRDDDDDEWDGEVMELYWTGETPVVHLAENGSVVHSEDWHSLSGNN
ncbi:hypothetical protein [Photobacterium leiognathi]|uniref:hypothetical protein n=1 Tax=Photobacterium leiognathi TaxID=553611 RepID=UPI0029810E06|nr:hypothetical protein [Photobacterium leiognathi]